MIVEQSYEYTKKIFELCTLHEWIGWFVNYSSIKGFFKAKNEKINILDHTKMKSFCTKDTIKVEKRQSSAWEMISAIYMSVSKD